MIRNIFTLIVLGISAQAYATEPVQFTNRELGAAVTILRPELIALELNGQHANFTPAPALKYMGVEASSTELDLSMIGDIVGLEFNHLKAKTPELKFSNGSLEVSVPVEDRVSAVQSRLGSISFQNVVLKAQVGWKTHSNGSQELVVQKTVFSGSLRGTGVLKPNFILQKTRELCMSLLTKSLRKFLAEEQIQEAVKTGLTEYAKFYSGTHVKEIVPGSIYFSGEGLKYDVN